eukprot:g27204.t1
MMPSPCHCARRRELCSQLRQWHLKVIEIVKRGQHRKSLDKLFQGFKPAIEACYFSWEEAFPVPGITYNSTEKKSAFCWAKAVPHKSSKACADTHSADSACEPGSKATPTATGPDGNGPKPASVGKSRSPPEPVVRPKDGAAKRKAGSDVSRGNVGRPSSTATEAEKPVYKPGPTKCKLPQGKCSSGKHSGKRRTSSEDSSLEPDLAELGLDDGNLALGAEASNTFDFDDGSFKDLYPDESDGFFAEGFRLETNGCAAKPQPGEPPEEMSNGEPETPAKADPSSKTLGPEIAESPAAGEDDYQVYYLNPQEVTKEEGNKEGGNEEEQDIFAGLKPLEQESRME